MIEYLKEILELPKDLEEGEIIEHSLEKYRNLWEEDHDQDL